MEFMEAVVVSEREGRGKDAVRYCDRGLRRFPEDFYLLMKRLDQARSAGDRALGESLLARAVIQCPPTTATFCSVGEEYAALGQIPEAEAWFRRALDRSPSNSLVREKLAMALVHQGRMEEGMAELRVALRDEPTNANRRSLLTQVLMATGRYAEVIEMVQALPEEQATWEDLTSMSAAQAHLDGASATAEALLHPDHTEDPAPAAAVGREER